MNAQQLLLTIKDVELTVQLKKSKIYELIDQGEFPRQMKIDHASRWHVDDIRAWVEARRKKARRAA